jgi:ABC-type phosphate transport system permease subunit
VIPEVSDDRPYRPKPTLTTPDRLFRGLATAAAMVSLILVGLTAIFLVDKARPALGKTGIWNFFTKSVWHSTSVSGAC